MGSIARFPQNRSRPPGAAAFVDALEWPALLLDDAGLVVHANALMHPAATAPNRCSGQLLELLYPDYGAALDGKAPWRTPQSQPVTRSLRDGTQRLEQIHLSRLQQGACLIVLDLPRRNEAELDRVQAGRLASLGFMLASATHEINNPLTAIHSIVQFLQSREGSAGPAVGQGLQSIAINIDRILSITRKLNVFARVDPEAQIRFRIDSAIEEAVLLLGYDSLGETIKVSHEKNPAHWVMGYPGQLQQVFLNVLLNAAQAMSGKGSIFIESERTEAEFVEISVRDTGPGVREEHRHRVFEPFFSTKHQGGGTGLGLAISNEIVHEHHGQIRVSSPAEGGACFHVQLPLAQ